MNSSFICFCPSANSSEKTNESETQTRLEDDSYFDDRSGTASSSLILADDVDTAPRVGSEKALTERGNDGSEEVVQYSRYESSATILSASPSQCPSVTDASSRCWQNNVVGEEQAQGFLYVFSLMYLFPLARILESRGSSIKAEISAVNHLFALFCRQP